MRGLWNLFRTSKFLSNALISSRFLMENYILFISIRIKMREKDMNRENFESWLPLLVSFKLILRLLVFVGRPFS